MAKQARRAKRIKTRRKPETEKMPIFNEHTMQRGIVVVSDISGELYRIDADRGTIGKLRWQG